MVWRIVASTLPPVSLARYHMQSWAYLSVIHVDIYTYLQFLSFRNITLNVRDRINPVQHSKYHGSCCSGSLRRQDISTHYINYVR